MNLTIFSLIYRVLQTLYYLLLKPFAIALDAYGVYFTNISDNIKLLIFIDFH